jgi:hypothetical protein
MPMKTLVDLIEHHKLIRRLALLWACTLNTVILLRVTEPDVITALGAAGATVITAVVGILTSVIAFYQHHRSQDDA